jgi:hypothetical protein
MKDAGFLTQKNDRNKPSTWTQTDFFRYLIHAHFDL